MFSRKPQVRPRRMVISTEKGFDHFDYIDLGKWFEQEVDTIKQGHKNQTGLALLPDGRRVFVKRYQIKGPGQIIGFLLSGRNKASHCFNIAHRLIKLEIPVPKPLAAIRDLSGRPFSFYYICEALTGFATLREISRNSSDINPGMLNLITRIAELTARMHKSGIVHGDLKWPNIMIHSHLPFNIKLIDLDNTRPVNFPDDNLYALDLARFAVDMAENLPAPGLFAGYIRSYSHIAGIGVEQSIQAMLPYYYKIAGKHKKKYGHIVPDLNTLAEM